MSNESEIDAAIQELVNAHIRLGEFIDTRLPVIVGEEYVKEYVRAIDEGRSPGGVSHEPLKPQSSYPQKKSRDPRNLLLHDTGGMRGGAIYEEGRAKVEISVPYVDKRGKHPAGFHQDGGGKLPQRVVLEESDVAAEKIQQRCQQFVGEAHNPVERELYSAVLDTTLYGKKD